MQSAAEQILSQTSPSGDPRPELGYIDILKGRALVRLVDSESAEVGVSVVDVGALAPMDKTSEPILYQSPTSDDLG